MARISDVFNTEAHPFMAPDIRPVKPHVSPKKPEPFKVQGGELPQISPNPYLPQPLSDILGLHVDL